MTFLYLWRADGPRRGCRGISSDQGSARRAAASQLRSGEAAAALVVEATAELGMRTLTDSYYVTGQAWRARLAGGRVTWVPVPTPVA